MHGSYISKPAMQGDLDIVPGGGSSRPASSLIILAGKFIGSLCRPRRLRSRVGIALIVSLFLVAAYMVRSNTVCKAKLIVAVV
jgi:hypothetical protein